MATPGEVGGRHLVEAGVWREAFEDAPFEALRSELRELLPERTWRTPLRTEIWWTRRRAG